MKKIITTLALVSTLAFTGIAGAQTTGTDLSSTSTTGTDLQTTSVTDTSGSSTVGVPNTGAGGDAGMNYAILATSAALAIAAGAYALRSRRTL